MKQDDFSLDLFHTNQRISFKVDLEGICECFWRLLFSSLPMLLTQLYCWKKVFIVECIISTVSRFPSKQKCFYVYCMHLNVITFGPGRNLNLSLFTMMPLKYTICCGYDEISKICVYSKILCRNTKKYLWQILKMLG